MHAQIDSEIKASIKLNKDSANSGESILNKIQGANFDYSTINMFNGMKPSVWSIFIDGDWNSSFNASNQNRYKNNLLDTSPNKKQHDLFGAKKSVKYEIKSAIQEKEHSRQVERQQKLFNDSSDNSTLLYLLNDYLDNDDIKCVYKGENNDYRPGSLDSSLAIKQQMVPRATKEWINSSKINMSNIKNRPHHILPIKNK